MCHSHAKLREKKERQEKEDKDRAGRGVKLCIGGGHRGRKCPDDAEIPVSQKRATCDACTKFNSAKSSENRYKRLAAATERNTEKAQSGVRECTCCHEDKPLENFRTDRKKSDTYHTGIGREVSDRCRECREKNKSADRAEQLHEKRCEEKADREAVAKKALEDGKRVCSRHGTVTDG